ncbi:MAG: GtrA family protein [Anaerolineae bacterium]|nr:GtrA family protein [Anaerolineae bacterium]
MTTLVSRINKKEMTRFLKFAVVGGFGAIVDFVVLAVLERFVHPPASIDTWWSSIAVGISLSTAIVSNFIWNRYWTYPDSRSKPIVRQFAQFYVINILAYIIRGPIMLLETVFAGWLGRWFAFGQETTATLGTYVAWALGVGIAMFWNFFVNRFITYSDVDKTEQGDDADRD